MRRVLRPKFPLLTRFFGILPHHLDHMTMREVDPYLSTLAQILAEGGDPWQVVASPSSS